MAGTWDDQSKLDRFLQAYAVEKAKLEARKQEHAVSEQALHDGSIKLSIQVSRGVSPSSWRSTSWRWNTPCRPREQLQGIAQELTSEQPDDLPAPALI